MEHQKLLSALIVYFSSDWEKRHLNCIGSEALFLLLRNLKKKIPDMLHVLSITISFLKVRALVAAKFELCD